MIPSRLVILSELQKHVSGDFLIAGVGNEDKETDSIGIEIARKGKRIYPSTFIDCGVVPENYLGKITSKKVKTLIIIDAVHFTSTDEIGVFLPQQLSIQGISTHSSSLRLVAEYLKNYGIQTVIVGIKPQGHTEEIQKELLSAFLELIATRKTEPEGTQNRRDSR